MSSIFKIILVTSVASVKEEILTKAGCMILCSKALSTSYPVLAFNPQKVNWFMCLFLISVTIFTGFNPQFYAKVNGITSKACAYSSTIILSIPLMVYAYCSRALQTSISIAPPPATMPLFFTIDLTTHKASCIDLSASSMINLLVPLTKIVAVSDFCTSI